ncbi:MAG: hypothetical protein IJR54_04045 [Oscillibacter sp.]|nr:hypothetical protein [Oscillibacter sp.]
MTTLKRVLVSLPRDLETEIKRMKERPEFQNVPTSRILCGLIRKGLEAGRADTKEA